MYDPNHPDNIADQILIYALVSNLVYGARSRKDKVLCSYTLDETHPTVVAHRGNNPHHPSPRPSAIRVASLIVARMVSVLGAEHVSFPYFIDPEYNDEVTPQNAVVRDVLITAVIAAYTYSQGRIGEDADGIRESAVELMNTVNLAVEVEERSGIPNSAAMRFGPDECYRISLCFHAV